MCCAVYWYMSNALPVRCGLCKTASTGTACSNRTWSGMAPQHHRLQRLYHESTSTQHAALPLLCKCTVIRVAAVHFKMLLLGVMSILRKYAHMLAVRLVCCNSHELAACVASRTTVHTPVACSCSFLDGWRHRWLCNFLPGMKPYGFISAELLLCLEGRMLHALQLHAACKIMVR